MAGLYLPGAKWRPISYRAAAGKFAHAPLGYIVHVPVSNGSLFNYFNSLTAPGRKFCTAWVAKDGSSEQYTTLDMQAWAQSAGNADYWSFEVEGLPGEPMTGPQLDTLATWHNFLGAPDRIATAPGQQGIGTHQMGGAAWGGHSCPGPLRTAQLPQILTRAQALRAPKEWFEMPIPDADLNAIAARVRDGLLNADVIPQPHPTAANPNFTVASSLEWTGKSAAATQAMVTTLVTAVNALAQSTGADADAITKAVVDKINALDFTIQAK